MSESTKLPSLIDLVNDLEVYSKQDEFNLLMSQEPPKSWVAKHPFIKKEVMVDGKLKRVPYEYVPIDKVEYLLKKVFKKHKIEITNQGIAFNGVWVTVRVHYLDLVTGEWDYHDGIGAINLQVKKGSSPANLQDINNGALSMAFPHAKTLAIKDACDMFGTLFGANLNRRDVIVYKLDERPLSSEEKLSKIKEIWTTYDTSKMSEETIMSIERIIDQKEVSSYNKVLKLLS